MSSDWLSAIFTLLVLSGIYASMDNFDSYSSLYKNQDKINESKLITVASPYWNSDMNYGFRSIVWDAYVQTGSNSVDQVLVKSIDKTVYTHDGVKVSFYPNTPIAEIDKTIDPNTPRTYSRLANGIAVIEWDLNSASAKTIFSTLHSK